MPVKIGSDKEGCFAKWGKSGKKYYYPCGNEDLRNAAKQKAYKQGLAIGEYRIYEDSVTSTNVSRIKWDSITRDLLIEFEGGGVYRYSNVPEAVYLDVLEGQAGTKTSGPWGPEGKYPSVGAAVHAYLIEGGYSYSKTSWFSQNNKK
jgi:hypothetical protein